MGSKLMHQGKPWTGEGFPPDSVERAAVTGTDAETPVCTCGTHVNADESVGWSQEGHAPDCPVGQPAGVRSVVGGIGETVRCTCSDEWKGEGHAKGCAKRAPVAPCICRALKWDEPGHSPACVSQQTPDAG